LSGRGHQRSAKSVLVSVNHPEAARPRVRKSRTTREREREKAKVGKKTITPTKNKCSRIEAES
jgi:hypothetical protein